MKHFLELFVWVVPLVGWVLFIRMVDVYGPPGHSMDDLGSKWRTSDCDDSRKKSRTKKALE